MTKNPGMRKGRSATLRFVALLSLGGLIALSAVAGQRTRTRPSNGVARYHVVPFPFIERTLGFPPLKLPHSSFIEMAAVWVTLPKGFNHTLTTPENCLQLEYGYKKSGIVRLYEVRSIKGTTPKAMLAAIFNSKCFKDVSTWPGFAKTEIPDPTRFILLTSSDKGAFDAAKAELLKR